MVIPAIFREKVECRGQKEIRYFFTCYTLYVPLVYIADTGRQKTEFGLFLFLNIIRVK